MRDDRLAVATGIIAEVLGCHVGDVSPDAPVGALPRWDSIAHLSIILAVEARLGRQLTAEEIASLENVESFSLLFDPFDEKAIADR